MLNNMFNIFDPILINIPLNYISIMMIILLYFSKKNLWLNKSNYTSFMNKMIINEIINNNNLMNKSLINLFLNLFNVMILINLTNLIPNFFYVSTNIMFTLNMSFMMINMLFLFNINNNKNIFFMNLTPKNTPFVLIPLINMIELTSFFMQIITLSLRLMINMMLGHIIVTLMNNLTMTPIYMIIEMMIIMIQSYVFFILNLLNSNNMY